jgi:hypothetical protein
MLRTQICSRLRTSFASRSEVRVRTRARARARASSSEAFFSGEWILSAGPVPHVCRHARVQIANTYFTNLKLEDRFHLETRSQKMLIMFLIGCDGRTALSRAPIMCARLVVGWSQAWHLQRMYPRSARSDLAATHIWHDTFRPLSLGSAAPTDTVCFAVFVVYSAVFPVVQMCLELSHGSLTYGLASILSGMYAHLHATGVAYSERRRGALPL